MRIASLSPAATEILFALGHGGDIVCTDQFSNAPDEAKELPHVMGHQTMDPEELRKFRPELILTGTVVQQKLAETLRIAGFSVTHQDPRTVHEIYESIRQLGTILECEQAAEALVLLMQQGFNAVKKKAALLPRRPRVHVEEWFSPPFASGNWVPEVVRMAGGEAFSLSPWERVRERGESPMLSREMTLIEVQATHPDLIVVSWCGAGTLADKNLLLQRPGWGSLAAVQQGQVRVIDDSLLNRPGPRLVEGARRLYGWIFEMLH